MQYGLLGGKLGHSLSPQIHESFFRCTGLSGKYNLLETEARDLPRQMENIKNNYAGSNVTIPHKIEVMPYLDSIAPEAAAIGAVNTIAARNGKLYGYNTDYFGFGRMLEYNNIDAAGKTAVVLGSGGAARAVVKYLADKNAANIYLVTRAPEKADKHFLTIAPQLKIIDYAQLSAVRGYVIINCTPVGMYPETENCPVAESIVQSFDAAVDLIYNPAQTLFLRKAAAAGKKAVNGLFMLVAQAVAAQEIWQNKKYGDEIIIKIMTDVERKI